MDNDPTNGPTSLIADADADAVFILKGTYTCHECKEVTAVFALLLQGPFQAT